VVNCTSWNRFVRARGPRRFCLPPCRVKAQYVVFQPSAIFPLTPVTTLSAVYVWVLLAPREDAVGDQTSFRLQNLFALISHLRQIIVIVQFFFPRLFCPKCPLSLIFLLQAPYGRIAVRAFLPTSFYPLPPLWDGIKVFPPRLHFGVP